MDSSSTPPPVRPKNLSVSFKPSTIPFGWGDGEPPTPEEKTQQHTYNNTSDKRNVLLK